MREATKRLEAQGLVEIQHGKGIQAVDRLHRPLNDSLSLLIPDVADRLRHSTNAISIEPDAAAYAAERATQGQLRELRRIHEQLESALDMKQAVEADCAFHHAIAEASGNLVFRWFWIHLPNSDTQPSSIDEQRRNETGYSATCSYPEGYRRSQRGIGQEADAGHVLAAMKDIELPTLKKKRIR